MSIAQQTTSKIQSVVDPPGKWYGNFSIWPIFDAVGFFFRIESYMQRKQRRFPKNTVFRMHPGLKMIGLSDHISASFLVNAPASLLRRDSMPRFGAAIMRPYATDPLRPAVFSVGDEHARVRAFTEAALVHRQNEIAGAVEYAFKQYSNRWQNDRYLSLEHELNYVSATAAWKWLLDVAPTPEQIHKWHVNSVILATDTPPFSWIMDAMLKASPGKKVIQAAEEMAALVCASPLWPTYQRMAQEYGIPEEGLAEMMVFQCTVNGGGAISRTLYPTLTMLYLNEDLRQRVRASYPQDWTDLDALDGVLYLDNFMTECNRLFTRPPLVVREAMDDFILLSGDGHQYQIRKGELLIAIMPYVHRDSQVFTNPNECDPERYDRDPALKDKVYQFFVAKGGESPYGCAANENRTAHRFWKALLGYFLHHAKYSIQPEPSISVNYFLSAGPPNIKFSDFRVTF